MIGFDCIGFWIFEFEILFDLNFDFDFGVLIGLIWIVGFDLVWLDWIGFDAIGLDLINTAFD